MNKSDLPNWDKMEDAIDVEVEEVVDDESADCLYKPRVSSAKKLSEKTGNLLPVINAITLSGGTIEEVKQACHDVTITSSLKTAMEAPSIFVRADGEVLNNAEAIGKVLVEKAISGDMAAIREVLNRTEGKVPNVTHNSSASVKVTGDANSIGSLMAKIDKNKGA